MSFKVLKNIQTQIETLEYESYTIEIKLKDKTNINLNKSKTENDKKIGFTKKEND